MRIAEPLDQGSGAPDHIIWEWANRSGLEHHQQSVGPSGTKAEGLIIADVNGAVVRRRYSMFAGPDHQIHRFVLFVMRGPEQTSIGLKWDPRVGWIANGVSRPDLSDCRLLDLSETPYTKTLLIGELHLAEGESREINVVTVDSGNLRATRQTQIWKRLAPRYEGWSTYECATNGLELEFHFNRLGLMTFSPGRWGLRFASAST